jgi:hypothetical protein
LTGNTWKLYVPFGTAKVMEDVLEVLKNAPPSSPHHQVMQTTTLQFVPDGSPTSLNVTV